MRANEAVRFGLGRSGDSGASLKRVPKRVQKQVRSVGAMQTSERGQASDVEGGKPRSSRPDAEVRALVSPGR